MGTNNFTYIANFIAKLAYIYVICNTYIPRVYISFHVVALSTNATLWKKLNLAKQERKFMNPKSGKIKHEK